MSGKHGTFSVIESDQHGNIRKRNRSVFTFPSYYGIKLAFHDFIRIYGNLVIHPVNFLDVIIGNVFRNVFRGIVRYSLSGVK